MILQHIWLPEPQVLHLWTHGDWGWPGQRGWNLLHCSEGVLQISIHPNASPKVLAWFGQAHPAQNRCQRWKAEDIRGVRWGWGGWGESPASGGILHSWAETTLWLDIELALKWTLGGNEKNLTIKVVPPKGTYFIITFYIINDFKKWKTTQIKSDQFEAVSLSFFSPLVAWRYMVNIPCV